MASNKRNQNRTFIMILIILLLVIGVVVIILYLQLKIKEISQCDYNSSTKTYLKTDANCVINFLCTRDSESFKDECGCGCQKINLNDEKNYCIDSNRNGQFCPEFYQPVCGWFDPAKVQCLKYPCANSYSNSCFACIDKKVIYWTIGACPDGNMPGSDRDSHGCIGSAGYIWCEAKQKCLRSWEENCSI